MNFDRNQSKCFCPCVVSKYYDPSDLELSFKLLDHHLASIKFDNSTDKFNYACSILPMEACKLVRDIIIKPPESYSSEILLLSLKERSFYMELENSTREFNQNVISNHKPSKILERMQEKCNNMNEYDLLPYFQRFLPSYMQSTICDPSRYIKLETFARFADMEYLDKYLKPKDSPTSSKYEGTEVLDFADMNNNMSVLENEYHFGLELMNKTFHSMSQKYKQLEEIAAKTAAVPKIASSVPESEDPKEKISVL